MKKPIRLIKGLLVVVMLTVFGLVGNANEIPQLTYASVREGGLLNPKVSSIRFDFDKGIQSLTWAYVQNGKEVGTGVVYGEDYMGDCRMFNIPVTPYSGFSLSKKVTDGDASYGDITLKIKSMTLMDDSVIDPQFEYDLVLTEKATVSSFYPALSYPGNDYQELKTTSAIYIYGPSGSKVSSATAEVYQNGAKLGEITYKAANASNLSYAVQIAKTEIPSMISRLGIKPGLLTIRATKIEWLNNGANDLTEDENLGEVIYEYKGNPANITSYSGLDNGVVGWFDANGADGLLTLNFDKQIAETGEAFLEYGTSGSLYTVADLPIIFASDHRSLQVDLRGRLLTIDAITGGQNSFVDEFGNTVAAPDYITLEVRNLKTPDGSAVIMKEVVGDVTVSRSHFSKNYPYAEGFIDLTGANALAVGSSALINVDGTHVTYVNDGRAFIQNDDASAMVNDATNLLSVGSASGLLGMEAIGNGAFNILPAISNISVVAEDPLAGTEIAKGTYGSNAGRLVTFTPFNTESMGFDASIGSYVIDGAVYVQDLFEALDIDYDWTANIASITGLLVPYGDRLILAPRSEDDIVLGESDENVNLLEAKATEPGEMVNVMFDHAKVLFENEGNMFIEADGAGIILMNWDADNDEPVGSSPFKRGDLIHGTATLLNYGNGVFANLTDLAEVAVIDENLDHAASEITLEQAASSDYDHRLVTFTNTAEVPVVYDSETGAITIGGMLAFYDMFGVLDDFNYDLIESINSVTGILYPTGIAMADLAGQLGGYVLVPRDKKDIDFVEAEIIDPNAPVVVYTSVRKGGLLSPKIPAIRFDFDRQIASLTWAFVQDEVEIASGTLEASANSNEQMFEIPVNYAPVSLSSKVANGEVNYGDITLKISKFELLDGTEINTRMSYNYTLTDKVTVASVYPSRSYPGNELQELRTNGTLTVTCINGSSTVSGEVEVYQNGELLGQISLEPFSKTSYGTSLKNANLESVVNNFNIQPGIVTFVVTKLQWLDADSNLQTTEDSNLFSIDLLFKGVPGKVLGSSGLSQGVKSWFDPEGTDGVLTISVDKPVADGVTAEMTYGTDMQSFIISNLPVSFSADRKQINIDLRGRLLTIDAITGEHNYIFYDEGGNEIDPPSKIILDVRNMLCTDGSSILTTYTEEGRTVTLSYFSKALNYTDAPLNVSRALATYPDETILLGVDGAKVTYEKDGQAYIEDETGALSVIAPENVFRQGILDGAIALYHIENSVFWVYNDCYDIILTPSNVSGTAIAKGAFAANENRLVTFNASNTDSMAYDDAIGAFVIDGTLVVADGFEALDPEFEWNQKITAVTGILVKLDNGKMMLYPRSLSDIKTVDLTSIGDACALAEGQNINLDVDNARITFELDGRAFVEDATGAAIIEASEGQLQQGLLSGYMQVSALGGSAFELLSASNLTLTPKAVSGTVIAKGAYEDNINRLVTFTADNTDSMVYDDMMECVMIDGMVPVLDLFRVLGDEFEWGEEASSVTGLLVALDGGSVVLAPRSVDDLNFEKIITLLEAKESKIGEIVEVTFNNVKVYHVSDEMGGMFVEDDKAGLILYYDDQAPFQRGDVISGTVKLLNFGQGVFYAIEGYDNVEPVGTNDHVASIITIDDAATSTYHHRLVTFRHTDSAPIIFDKSDNTLSINNQIQVDLRFVEDVIDLSNVRGILSVTGILYPTTVMTFDDDDEPLGGEQSSILLIPRTLDDIEFGEVSAVEEIEAAQSGVLRVYNLQGVSVKVDSLRDLAPGLYIVNGTKILVK